MDSALHDLFDTRCAACEPQVGGRRGGLCGGLQWLEGGRTLAVLPAGSDQLQMWDLRSLANPVQLSSLTMPDTGGALAQTACSIAASPDRRRLAVDCGGDVCTADVNGEGLLSGLSAPLLRRGAAAANPGVDWHRGGDLLLCARDHAAVLVKV